MVITKRRFRIISGALALLAMLIFCGMPFQHAAKAVAIVDDAIVAIVIAALAAMGITFTMTGGYQVVSDWVSEKIEESGIDFSGVKFGASSVGNLLLNNLFVRRIAAFAAYIQVELGLVSNATAEIINVSGYVLADGTLVQVGGDNRTKFSIGTVYVLRNGNAFWMDENPGSSETRRLYTLYKNEIEVVEVDSKVAANYTFSIASNDRLGLQLRNASGGIVASSTIAITVDRFFGSPDTTRLDAKTGTLDIPSDSDIGELAGVLSLPVPWGQSMGQTLTEIPGLVLDDELAGNTSLELEDASTVEEQVSDTATAEQPYVGTSANEYQSLGLTDVFPFCIPFDLYDLVSCLAADPEAPVISWRFYVPGICDETITIDLSRFDTVASVVRTMELLLFIVGLAMVTRDKFLRG